MLQRPPPRVLFLTSSYPASQSDWRSRFILDMLDALARNTPGGASIGYWGPPGPLPTGVRAVMRGNDAEWLIQLMERGGLAHLLRHRPLAGLISGARFLARIHAACGAARAEYEIAHVNWLQNLLGLPGDGKPALVTVLGSDFGLLRMPGVPGLMRHALRRRRCLLAPNAGWMVPRLAHMFGDVARVEAVPFGVADAWYGLAATHDTRPRRWLVVARVTRQKIGPLFEWGETLFTGSDELHLLGPMQDRMPMPDWIHYHGPTNPAELQGRWFPSATGLLTLSHHDEGRPQVLLEAMASGLPVIASRQPAHVDVIAHGETGFIVDNAAELRAAVEALADPTTATRIGGAARAWCAAHIGTWADTAARYRSRYARLLDAAA